MTIAENSWKFAAIIFSQIIDSMPDFVMRDDNELLGLIGCVVKNRNSKIIRMTTRAPF